MNTDDWKTFFLGQVKVKDLNFVIYKARIGELDTCIFYLKNNSYPIKIYLRNNSIFKANDKEILKDFLFYQAYAKPCEKYANFILDDWSSEPIIDPRKDTLSKQKRLKSISCSC